MSLITKERTEDNDTEESNDINSNIKEEILDPSYTINNWEDLDIHEDILRSIYAYGYEKPSPIQMRGCVPIIKERDVIAQAQSGTGKTATFVIGTLSRINLNEHATQALILAPTRELAGQVESVISGLSSVMKSLKTQLIVGGNSVDDDVAALKRCIPHIIVGCPGRVYDMLRRNYIHAKTIKIVVIDEADALLRQGV